jgi:5-oxopent-3-ene-1,2,5-tricarboxylate decarboxylase/2-hydroxyhepta-2,4-diene-1,7-dioate isomerase
VAGCVLDDLSLPHASYYRPAIRYRNRDGFLVCAPSVTPLREVAVKALKIEVRVNGARVQTVDLSTLVRDAATLLADVGAFMTCSPATCCCSAPTACRTARARAPGPATASRWPRRASRR